MARRGRGIQSTSVRRVGAAREMMRRGEIFFENRAPFILVLVLWWMLLVGREFGCGCRLGRSGDEGGGSRFAVFVPSCWGTRDYLHLIEGRTAVGTEFGGLGIRIFWLRLRSISCQIQIWCLWCLMLAPYDRESGYILCAGFKSGECGVILSVKSLRGMLDCGVFGSWNWVFVEEISYGLT